MYVCMYVSMFVCVCVYIYVRACAHLHKHIYIRKCTYMHGKTFMFVMSQVHRLRLRMEELEATWGSSTAMLCGRGQILAAPAQASITEQQDRCMLLARELRIKSERVEAHRCSRRDVIGNARFSFRLS